MRQSQPSAPSEGKPLPQPPSHQPHFSEPFQAIGRRPPKHWLEAEYYRNDWLGSLGDSSREEAGAPPWSLMCGGALVASMAAAIHRSLDLSIPVICSPVTTASRSGVPSSKGSLSSLLSAHRALGPLLTGTRQRRRLTGGWFDTNDRAWGSVQVVASCLPTTL